MLHLKFALNLENLADEMISTISAHWKNPFVSPIVVLPDPKLEQWFRLRWIQKKNTLMGLSTMMIDRFLMEILVGDNDHKHKLSADMLCNVILAYLKMEEGGEPNYLKLGEEVRRYLVTEGADGSSQLDETHLFDFAQKMASLFLEYETSRPRDFTRNADGTKADGILDCWKQGDLKPFFATGKNSDVVVREKWQQKLYSALFHKNGDADSLLTRVFQKEAIRKNDSENTYLTIPFLYYSCFDAEGKATFHLEKIQDQPLFIFGLSGMGQFYRVILQKFAEEHEVFAYIQNPCMEFWEDIASYHGASLTRLHRKWTAENGIWNDEAGNDLNEVKQRMDVNLGDQATTEVTDPDDISEYRNPAEENAENSLLCTWGKSGRDNIKLWCQAANYDFDFDASEGEAKDARDLPQDTLLHKLQYAIANRTNIVTANATEKADGATNIAETAADTSLILTAAPTKIREVETLHTNICKLLQNGNRINDILVVSPDLDSYRTAIKSVFDQTPERPDKDAGILHVPFSIVDSPAHSSLTESALNDLFAILDGGTVTRPQFFNLMRNPIVQQTRGIREDEVNNWESWIEETNVYRDRNSKKQDWTDGVRRLLLARMTKNLVKLESEGETLKPYSDMATSNNASLCRFVEAINDLKKWIEFGSQGSISNLDQLSEFLNSWLAMAGSEKEFAGESIIFKRVTESVKNLHYQLDTGIEAISWKIIEQSLITAAQGSAYSCGNLFVNGITFMKFIPNRIIPVKHLFFIGADSVNFPGAKQQNTLDLRKSTRPWPGDDSPVAKRRYAFLCQFMSVSESIHMSYVDQDIRKDAELYPTSIVNDIQKFLEKNSITWNKEKISLDETRETSQLFTPKSLRNKKAYVDMIHNGNAKVHVNIKTIGDKSTDVKNMTIKIPERVSIFQLRQFLEDPFQFRIGLMMIEQDDDDPEKELFEPIYFNKMEESTLLKMLLAAELSGKEDELNKFMRDETLKGYMPDQFFSDKIWKDLEKKKQCILTQMGDTKVKELKDHWTYKDRLQDLQLLRGDNTKWNLSGTMDWCNNQQLDQVTEIISVTTSDKSATELKFSKYADPYIKALALLALKCEKNPAEKDLKKTINISIYTCDSKLGGPATTKLTMTPEEATRMLEQIYNEAFGNQKEQQVPYSKAVPADLLNEIKDSDNIYDYRTKIMDGPWKYFRKKALFDPAKNVGFEADKFQEQWQDAKNKMMGLMIIKPYDPSAKQKDT